MAQDASVQEAIQLLRDRLGMRWEGERDDGVDEMIRVLESSLNFSKSQARDTVDALITSGELTYNQAQSVTHDTMSDDTATRPGSGVVALPGTGSAPMPSLALNGQEINGYWRLGRDSSDPTDHAPIAGRAGQIDPTS